MKSKCCGAEISGGSGFLYVTPSLFPRIKGNPMNLPATIFICSKCKKPCELKKQRSSK